MKTRTLDRVRSDVIWNDLCETAIRKMFLLNQDWTIWKQGSLIVHSDTIWNDILEMQWTFRK